MLLLHAQRERETLSVGVAHRMRTPCSPRIAPFDLGEPLKKHRRRKDMQREPKAQRGSSKDHASASNAGPRSDDRNSRPEGKTSPRRRGRIPTRNKPSRRTQGMPQPPPCARRRIQPTTPGQSTLSPATHSPRRRHGAAPEENPRPSPYFGGSFRLWPARRTFQGLKTHQRSPA